MPAHRQGRGPRACAGGPFRAGIATRLTLPPAGADHRREAWCLRVAGCFESSRASPPGGGHGRALSATIDVQANIVQDNTKLNGQLYYTPGGIYGGTQDPDGAAAGTG